MTCVHMFLQQISPKELNEGLNENDSLSEFHLCKMFIDQAVDFLLRK